MEDMPCMDVCEPSDACEDCVEEHGWDMEALEEELMGDDDDMDMDMDDRKGGKGKGNKLFFKAFEHGRDGGRPTDEEMGDHMEDMGMPEECLEACMPTDDCVDCAMEVDWEAMEDPCEDLDDMDDMMECYEEMMEDMPCMDVCEPSDDCEDCVEEHGWDMEALEEELMGDDDDMDMDMDGDRKGGKGGKGN